MADSYVVSALKEKRARLAGELISTRIRAIALQTDLDHVDACLRVFRAGIDPEQIEPKRTNGKSPAGLRKGLGTRTALASGTLWMTQDQMATVFGVDRSGVAKHLKNIFAEGELQEAAVCARNALTAADGKTYTTAQYNLGDTD